MKTNENREKRENNGIEKKSVTEGGFIRLLVLFYYKNLIIKTYILITCF